MNVRNRLLASIAILSLSFSAAASTASAETPTQVLESQVWWNKAGIVVPTAVGSHTHVRVTVPVDGAIVDGIISVPVTIISHDSAGPTN